MSKQSEQVQEVHASKYEKVERRSTVAVLLLLLLCISIGYAAVSSTLKIIGTGVIPAMKWDVHFENVEATTHDVTITTPATIQANTTDITYEIKLNNPGSYYTFDVDVVNSGSIDAKLAITPEILGISVEQDAYTNYSVTYKDGTPLAEGDVIKAGESRKITVYVGLDLDVKAEDLPATAQTLSLNVDLDYIQADEN